MTVRLYSLQDDITRAVEIGTARYEAARRRGYRHRGPARAGPANDIAGVLCEILCGRYFDLPFNPSIDQIDNIDLVKIEVRGRLLGKGFLPELAYSHEDKHRNVPKVLCHVTPTLAWIDVIGWLLGWELWRRVQELELKKNEASDCWFVPPPYHSVQSLQDWLLCGAPPHINPGVDNAGAGDGDLVSRMADPAR